MAEETHETCTSNKKLEDTTGSSSEHIAVSVLNTWYEKLFGHKVSDDPIVARIQREQAIVRHKRDGK